MRQRHKQEPYRDQVNVRMEDDQKAYLDQWAQALYWKTGALCRLLVIEKIIEHSTRTGASLPQSIIDAPPMIQVTSLAFLPPPPLPRSQQVSRKRHHDPPRLPTATALPLGPPRPPAPPPARKRV